MYNPKHTCTYIIHLFVIFRSCFVIEFIFFLLYIFVRYWYEIFGLSLVMCELADTYMLYYSFCISYMLVLDSHWSERMYTQLLHCKFISHNLCWLFRIEWGGLTTVVGSSVHWWFEKPNPWFQNVYYKMKLKEEPRPIA